MTIYKSNLPSIDLPVTDTYSLVFEKNNLPDSQIALIDSITQRKITRGELKRDIQRLASGLRNNLHLDRAVVAFLCPNDVQYPVIMFGIVRAGCTISPMNPGYTPVEIAYQVKDSGAKYLVTHVAGVAMALEAAKFAGLASSNVIVLGDEPVAGQRCVKDIVSDKPLSPLDWTQEELRDRPAYLCYSSGTTGRSKGVMSSHHNITSNILQYTAACRAFGHLGENDVWYVKEIP
ncbi:hypothetical protein HKX48_006387 [Thoreauomyces humboldtii]|nr:hypothetical protein HKX48_006387 [Thoreauomyces humboldtii]